MLVSRAICMQKKIFSGPISNHTICIKQTGIQSKSNESFNVYGQPAPVLPFGKATATKPTLLAIGFEIGLKVWANSQLKFLNQRGAPCPDIEAIMWSLLVGYAVALVVIKANNAREHPLNGIMKSLKPHALLKLEKSAE